LREFIASSCLCESPLRELWRIICLGIKLVRVPALFVLDSLLHSCFNVGRFRGGVGSSRSPSGGSNSSSSSRPVAVVVDQFNSDVRFANIFFNNLDLIDLSRSIDILSQVLIA
jgi:hypothetical protein